MPLFPVPSMTRIVEGSVYGGAYWDHVELEVSARVDVDADVVILELLDSSGHALVVHALSAEQSSALHEALAQPAVSQQIGTLTVARSVTLDLVDEANEAYAKDVADDELVEWLACVTGKQAWDGGDTWDY